MPVRIFQTGYASTTSQGGVWPHIRVKYTMQNNKICDIQKQRSQFANHNFQGKKTVSTYTNAKKTPVQPSRTSQAHSAGSTFDFPLHPTMSSSIIHCKKLCQQKVIS